ncbi:hypothetical protein HPB50_015443 [Hyalomma asiaticum]|uniref:Uncharacterized protein n=1 Tax=Hyalomma asiaticum TaxID=266040 RepID=A0ACB7SYY8_HYAAI|nr:hypothetical protein HPB50_015443 [Hyalomma asiaticum]
MAWSTISHSGNQASAPSEPIRNEYLFRLVESAPNDVKQRCWRPPRKALTVSISQSNKRRPRARKMAMSNQHGSRSLFRIPPGRHCSCPEAPYHSGTRATFQPGELGHSLRAYLGAQLAADLSFVLSREQSLILVSTKNAYVADRLFGDFVIKSAKGDVSFHGHLKESGEEVCRGQAKDRPLQLRNNHCPALLPDNRCLRRVCGTVGHRADTCPNPSQDRCGLCGQQAPFVEGVRAPHKCTVKCALFGGGHATNSKDCASKYRKDTKMAAQKGAKNNSAKKPATPKGTRAAPSSKNPRCKARVTPGQTVPKRIKTLSTAEAELHNVVAPLRAQNEMLLAKTEALEKQSTRPSQPAPHAQSMESDAAAPTTLPLPPLRPALKTKLLP